MTSGKVRCSCRLLIPVRAPPLPSGCVALSPRLRRSQSESELMTGNSRTVVVDYDNCSKPSIIYEMRHEELNIAGNCRFVLTLPLSIEEQLMCCQVARFQSSRKPFAGTKASRFTNSVPRRRPKDRRRPTDRVISHKTTTTTLQVNRQLFAADCSSSSQCFVSRHYIAQRPALSRID